ncbi:MAG: adenylate/guanylate cyclase domain-containing protein, partial [Candidatus Riflebacteria bacterium]
LKLFRNEAVYIYEPLPKTKILYAGAVLPIDSIKRKSDFKKLLLFFLIAILSVSIYLLSASVTSLMIRPTEKLARVFTDIARGKLDTTFTCHYNNELGALAQATDLMINGLKERKVLGKFVSKTFDSEVISHTTSESAREMCGVILFSDIRSFTTISENNPAETVAELLNSHLKEMVEIINQNGGEIEQFIGDAIVAFFPGEGEAACKRAVAAARHMMLRNQSISLERARQNHLTCEIGIGLDYGQIMAGILKSGSRSEFCVIGPARANAEHFEALSKSGRYTRIMLGNSLTRLLPDSDKIVTEHDNQCGELITLEQNS